MKHGNVIILNGVSSAGKSTLARELQKILREPYYYIAQDTFTHVIAPNYTGKYLADDRLNPAWKRAVSAMHHVIKLYSDIGNNVIVDHVLTCWRDEYDGDESYCELRGLLEGYPVYWVHVTCPLEELRRREVERADRTVGAAEWQLGILTPTEGYDIVIDTHEYTPKECAEKVARLI